MKKRIYRKLTRNKVRAKKVAYITIMIAMVCSYLVLRYACGFEWISDVSMAVIAIIAAVAFWIEYYDNKLLNEAQFINDLNEQFISDVNMTTLEWKLELFYDKYKRGVLTDDYVSEFGKDYSMDRPDRQHLVNYLVHLEGVAALVDNGVLNIESIENLMSYRYFIAVNNPVVQKLELLQYPDFYRGCISLYKEWSSNLIDKGIMVPMYDDYNLLKNFDD